MNLLIPLLGVVCAVTLVAFARKCLRHEKPSPLLYMIVSVYLIVRLIVNFQKWSTDPSLNDFVYHLVRRHQLQCWLPSSSRLQLRQRQRRITLILVAVRGLFLGHLHRGLPVRPRERRRYSGRPAADHGCNASAAAVQPAQNEPEEKTL